MAQVSRMKTLLVTGGAGFVGSALVRQLIEDTDSTVVNVDALTYAGDLGSLAGAERDPRHVFEHVDRSIDGPTTFVETNVQGTCNLLESARAYLDELPASMREAFRFLHVSTDEVYGDLTPEEPAFDEQHPYAPSSPYSATKAAADHLVRAWHRTYGLPVLVTHCANNYGPYQLPDNLIPLMIGNALAGKPLPVYGEWVRRASAGGRGSSKARAPRRGSRS